MKKIIAFIDHETNREIVIDSALELAKLLNLEIILCHLVLAPTNWEQLNRSARDKYPDAKLKINEARNLMDEILGEIRLKNIKAKKRFFYFDSTTNESDQNFYPDELLVMEKGFLTKSTNQPLRDLLFNLEPSKLILSGPLHLDTIADIVYTSSFQQTKPAAIEIINEFYQQFVFNLNLVFINTKEEQENSAISITNMKRVIAENGFGRTSISIFYSDRKIPGAELFASLKGGDLILLECSQQITNQELKKLTLPLILINKCNE